MQWWAFPQNNVVSGNLTGELIGWSIITVDNVTNHFPESVEMQKMHTKKHRQRVRSMKLGADEGNKILTGDSNMVTGPHHQGEMYQDLCIKVYSPKDTMYTNQTWHFPISQVR